MTKLIPEWFINKKILGRTMRFWLPVIVVVAIIGGLFSPLFDMSQIHGIASAKLYTQHFYLDACAGLGGYWAATMCNHRWHRILVMVLVDILVTFLLVTLIG